MLFSTTVSQSVQLDWPGRSTNFPFSQSVQSEAAIPLMEPGRQGKQALLSVLLWVPAVQGLQKPEPGGLTKPALPQGVQSSAFPRAKLPAGQMEHEADPVAEKVPAAHEVHELSELLALNDPEGHCWQDEDVASKRKPGGQTHSEPTLVKVAEHAQSPIVG